MNTEVLENYRLYLCEVHLKENTIRNKYARARQFYSHTNGIITKQTVQNWRLWANNRFKKNTLNQYIESVNLFLKWLGYPEHKMKLVGIEDSNEYSLNERDYDLLREKSKANPEVHLIFELLDSLVRPGEIIDIKITNLHDDILYLDDTKTGNNHIIVNSLLREAWDNYLRNRPEPLYEYQDYLLIGNDPKFRGQKYHTTLPIRNRISDLGHNNGIIKRVKPYTIKRSSITLKMDGWSKYHVGDPKLVQMMARHRDIKTTMKYNRKTDNDIRRYNKSLNDISPEIPKVNGVVNNIAYKYHSVNSQDLNKPFESEMSYGNSSFTFSFFFFSGSLNQLGEIVGEEGCLPDCSSTSGSLGFYLPLLPPNGGEGLQFTLFFPQRHPMECCPSLPLSPINSGVIG